MKISLRKRIIAFMLSVILLFSGSISGFASELLESDPMAEAAAAVVSEEATEPATEAATEATETSAAIISEEITEATEAVTEEVTEPATEAVTEEATEAAAKEETVEETEEEIVEETETETVEETEEETEESEEETQVLEYEDDDVKIHVSEKAKGAIPKDASLKVTPITESDKEYNEVEKQLNEKAEGEEYEIAGFLAYDITFVDKDGNKVEPNGDVRVTIDYKQATLPEAVNAEEFNELDVTVMHFEEDASGEVKEVVDMVAEENIEAEVTTTDQAEAEKAEFVTSSFSVYTITWKWTETWEWTETTLTLEARVVDPSGESITGMVNVTITPNLGENIEYVFKDKCNDINVGALTYKFVKAVYSDNGEFSRGVEIYSVDGHNGWRNDRIRYKLSSNGEWKDVGEGTVYLIYEMLSPYSVTANMIDLSGQSLGTTTIRLNENEAYVISSVGNTEVNGTEYTYLSAYVMEGETRVDVKSVIYKSDGKYYYTDDMGDEYELTSEIQLYLEYAGPGRITYDVLNMSGEVLEKDKTLDLPYGESYQLKQLSYVTVNDVRYSYSSAYIMSGDEAITVSEIIYNEGKYFYKDDEGNLVEIAENDSLYLKYRSSSDELTTISTVDHTADGIVMKMFDYNFTGGNPTNSDSNKVGFMNIQGGWNNGAIRQGLLKSRLVNGYPQTVGKTSLSSIFGGEGSVDGGSVVKSQDVNHLFSQAVYNATGYYEFSSFENYAYLNDDGNFMVYEQIGSPEKTNLGTAGSIDHILYQRGHFYPYNNITKGDLLNNQYNMYDEDAHALSEGGYRYREPLYKINNPNYYFGMYMEATFIQPKDGKVTWKGTTSNMRYEFNGDDDLWVFIDDVLVLDLGGIHVAHRGYIDFATGDVAWDESNNGATPVVHTNLKTIYQNLGIFPDGEKWENSEVDKYFDGNTFANYTPHELKMFYMERGDGGSDLHIKFNLPAIPKSAVTVQKEITNYTSGAYNDVEFSFKMHVKDENGKFNVVASEAESGEDVTKNIAAYTHVTADGKETIKTVGSDGIFKLKHNEKAIFKNIAPGTIYKVEEVGITQNTYDNVDIVGSGVVNFDKDYIGDGNSKICSKELKVGEDLFVLFQNQCAATNMKNIYINKALAGNEENNDIFSVKVTVAGKPYEGSYKLLTKDSNGKITDTKMLTTASDGIIKLKANQTAVVLGYASITNNETNTTTIGIPSGTSFKVEEVNLSSDKYKEPTYTVLEESVKKDPVIVNGYSGCVSGEVILENNAEVTITNTVRKTQLIVEKKFVGPDGSTEISAPNDLEKIRLSIREFYVPAEGEEDLSPVNETHQLVLEKSPEGVFTGTISGVQTYTQFEIVENSEEMFDAKDALIINEGDWKILENGGWTYTKSGSGNSLVINGKLTNKLDGTTSVTVNKVWEDDNNRYGFRPEEISVSLFKKNKDGNTDLIETVTLNSEGEWKHTFSKLPKYLTDGTLIEYTVSEENVPDGYVSTVDGTTITNTLKYTWNIVKVSSSSDDITLNGAEFSLTNKADQTKYIGVSKSQGIIEWTLDGVVTEIPLGEYTLKETKAPSGYALSLEEWTLTLESGKAPVVTSNVTDKISVDEDVQTRTYKFMFENEALYALPSSGGIGIYWYMIAGMFLMMAATVITYKNRRKEVLERIDRR